MIYIYFKYIGSQIRLKSIRVSCLRWSIVLEMSEHKRTQILGMNKTTNKIGVWGWKEIFYSRSVWKTSRIVIKIKIMHANSKFRSESTVAKKYSQVFLFNCINFFCYNNEHFVVESSFQQTLRNIGSIMSENHAIKRVLWY